MKKKILTAIGVFVGVSILITVLTKIFLPDADAKVSEEDLEVQCKKKKKSKLEKELEEDSFDETNL